MLRPPLGEGRPSVRTRQRAQAVVACCSRRRWISCWEPRDDRRGAQARSRAVRRVVDAASRVWCLPPPLQHDGGISTDDWLTFAYQKQNQACRSARRRRGGSQREALLRQRAGGPRRPPPGATRLRLPPLLQVPAGRAAKLKESAVRSSLLVADPNAGQRCALTISSTSSRSEQGVPPSCLPRHDSGERRDGGYDGACAGSDSWNGAAFCAAG